jgi:hypothetical protein
MKLNKAIEFVFDELSKLSDEEFTAKLKEHENGEYAIILRNIWSNNE